MIDKAAFDLMCHALGSSHSGTEVGWRNGFAAGIGTPNHAAWEELCEQGFARCLGIEPAMAFYCVTDAGIAYVKKHFPFPTLRRYTISYDGHEWSAWGKSAGAVRWDAIRSMEWIDRCDHPRVLKAMKVSSDHMVARRDSVWP